MANVNLDLCGRHFTIECNDGEEAHVRALADQLLPYVEWITQSSPQMDDAQVVLIAALAAIGDLSQRPSEHPAQVDGMGEAQLRALLDEALTTRRAATEALLEAARRVEAIAQRIGMR